MTRSSMGAHGSVLERARLLQLAEIPHAGGRPALPYNNATSSPDCLPRRHEKGELKCNYGPVFSMNFTGRGLFLVPVSHL